MSTAHPHLSRALGRAAWAAAALLAAGEVALFIADINTPGPLELQAAALLLVLAAALGAGPLGRRLGAAPVSRPRSGALTRGLLAGLGPAAVLCALVWLTGAVAPSPATLDGASLWTAVLAAALGWCSELFIRGSAFGAIEARTNAETAIWGSVLLLFAVDLLLGLGPVPALTVAGLGMFWGRLRVADASPHGPAVAHGAWNAAVSVALGLRIVPGAGPLLLERVAWWAGPPGAGDGGLAALLVALGCAVATSPRTRTHRL